MKKVSKIIVAGFMGGITLLLAAPLAMAHGQPEVSWSISIGSPSPALIYSPPPVVYIEPQPTVYVQPRPIYVESAPVVQYRTYYPEGYYMDKGQSWNRGHWKRHHHHDD